MVATSAASARATTVPPGLGEYLTLHELAAGGMGSVFLARALRGPHAGKLVALKRMHPHLERNPQFGASFFDEARITAGLSHPNIVETYDWGTDTSGHYIALEFVAGDSLLNLLKGVRSRGEQLPVDVVLFIIGKTAEALHAAHELRNERGELKHLVHRDVTPSNVLLSRDGRVKLIDFGVAKARERLQENTATNTLKGKFGYMSPEQARGQRSLDRRSDLWSLGVVLWECLAGRRLFKSESELEILRMVTEDRPASVRSIRPEVPEAIDTLLEGAFAKNRDDRFGSCAEFAEYLWAVFREEGFSLDEAQLAEFFARALPERCATLDRLLAGDTVMPLPAPTTSGSGSFRDPAPRADEDASPSGLHPVSPPSVAEEARVSTIDPSSVRREAPARRGSRVASIVLASIGLFGLGAGGVLLMKNRASASVPTTPSGPTAAIERPAVPPTALPPVVPETPVENTTAGATTPPTTPSTTHSVVGRGSRGPRTPGPSRNPPSVTAQQVREVMLLPDEPRTTPPSEPRPQTATRPVENRPAENRPVENRPVENRPVENRPANPQPTAGTGPTNGASQRRGLTLQNWSD